MRLDVFAERVRARRLRLGLCQEEVADIVGVARTTIANLESGRFCTSVPRLVDLARALQTTPDYLLGYRKRP